MPHPDPPDPVQLIIYGDFNCPFSAVASSRAAVLEQRGDAEVDWRAVEHDTSIPRSGEVMTGDVRDAFDRELGQIRDLLADGEPDQLRLPNTRVNTCLVTHAYATTPWAARPMLRERLFAAYWHDGDDLADGPVVRRLCGERRDQSTSTRWREEWMALPEPIVPVMVLPDGYVSRGLGALARLARLMGGPSEAPRV